MNDPIANAKYRHMNERIEIVSEFYSNAMTKLNVFAIFLPALSITIVNYFILDLDDDELYFLPLAILYVCRASIIIWNYSFFSFSLHVK